MAISAIIEAKRLRIVPFSEEQLTPRYISWLNDPEVVRFSKQRRHTHTLESCSEYLESFKGTPNFFWAILARDHQLEHIGTMNAYIDTVNLVADVGIMIGEKRVWGAGYGSEALSAVCNYLIKEVGTKKVTVGTLSENKAMISIARNAGMVEDGRRIHQEIFEDSEVDILHFAMFRDKPD